MIGLLFLLGMGLWFIAAIMLSKRIPRWLGVTKYRVAISVLLFPVVLAAPIADDLVGRWQFYRLCDREAVVTLSPDADKVTRAQSNHLPITLIAGYAIPIWIQRVEFVDVDTGKQFLSYTGFHADGGFLHRHLYGLGSSTPCWPTERDRLLKKLNIDQLIAQGKTK